MDSDFRDLYQEEILDHSHSPRNFRKIEDATVSEEGLNALCGDQMTLYLQLDGETIQDIAFYGMGCAISKASSSLMTTAVKGKTQAEALSLFERVHTMLTIGPDAEVHPEDLGKLAVLSGLWEYPMRIKCATLGWYTLKKALESPRQEGRP